MAQRAGHAYFRELTSVTYRSLHADHRIQAQQLDRDGRVHEKVWIRLQRGNDLGGQRLDIDLQANGQRCCRIDGGNDFVHSQHVGPELLVAKCIEAKYRPAVEAASGWSEAGHGERHCEDEHDGGSADESHV